MMTKFKVGDKIRVIKPHFYYEIDDVVVIKGIGKAGDLIIDGFKFRSIKEKAFTSVYIHPHNVELVQEKQTKNQRIAALENEVAELKLIVNGLRDGRKTTRDVMNEVLSEPSTTNTVEHIEFEGQQYRKVDREARKGDVITPTKGHSAFLTQGKMHKVVEDGRVIDNYGHDIPLYTEWEGRTPETVDVYELIEPTLTPNQQRAAIIEKAKNFVEDNKTEITGEALYSKHKGTVHTWRNIYVFANKAGKHACNVEFVVDAEKRTITAFMRGVDTNNIYEEATAKFNPSDVFNEHIGKAIALGRALGLDVSEFEQVVQPTGFASGQIVNFEFDLADGTEFVQFEIKSSEGDTLWIEDGSAYDLCDEDGSYKIINDTNAIY